MLQVRRGLHEFVINFVSESLYQKLLLRHTVHVALDSSLRDSRVGEQHHTVVDLAFRIVPFRQLR